MAITYKVPSEAAKQRLDAWLAGQLTGVSRERVQLLIQQEQIRLDGKPPRASYRLRGGESVEVLGDPTPPPLKAFAEDIPLQVVYEDDELSVIDKPAGMMVHTGAGAVEGGTLVNALLHRYRSLSSVGGEQRPGIVHRLDKQTSGLIIIARNDAAHARLAQMLAERQMKKTYIALVHGHLKQDHGTVDAPIARDLLRRTRMTTRRQTGARTAVSHYTVLRRVSSLTAITDARDEFLSALTDSLPSAGTIVRIACGAITRRISTVGVMPRAWPAATCPRSTPSTPERRISAMNGPSFAASARPAAPNALSLSPMCGSAS